jgi:hypothetical protein
MLIKGTDIFTGESVELTASFTTDHPASSYDQAVMVVDEWDGGAMDLTSWTLSAFCVVEATDEEMTAFDRWVGQFPIG